MSAFIPVEELFSGRHFDREIIVLCVRCYLSFKLSYRDLVMMMGERGIGLAHTTIISSAVESRKSVPVRPKYSCGTAVVLE
jgi:transposase-like protein